MNYDKPVFLIQNNYFDKLARLIQPCLDFCRDHDHDFIDRSLTDDFDPDGLGVNWNDWPGVIVYGSVGWVKRCRDSSLAPWTFYEPEAFAASRWAPRFGNDALNVGGVVMSIAEVRERLLAGARLHLRPDNDDKAFVGGVHDIATWDEMFAKRRVEGQRIPDDGLACFASPVKEIDAEYRCWFVDGDLTDISFYRKDGRQHVERCLDSWVMREAMRLAEIYLPTKSVVMDIAETADGFKVIEFNPINSSGWYAADADGIFTALSDMIRRGRPPKSIV